MMKQINDFSKAKAMKGQFRESIKDMKINLYRDVVDKLSSNPMSLKGVRQVARIVFK